MTLGRISIPYVGQVPVVVVVLALLASVPFGVVAAVGVWPPVYYMESGSMEPNVGAGDPVLVVEEHRITPAAQVGETGVVTARRGEEYGYESVGGYGDVIVFAPHGDSDETPILHRAMFWVDRGENWYRTADGQYVGAASSCAEIRTCPAPHAGFVTKGDGNGKYDQTAAGIADVVRPEWIRGTVVG